MKLRYILRAAAVVIVLVGIGIRLYPRYTNWQYQKSVSEMRQSFTGSAQDQSGDQERDLGHLELLRAMQAYNAQLAINGQSGLVDEASYEQPSFDLTEWGIEDNVFGFLDIPAIDVTLPIYLGANEANMKAGAAHLSNTSLPIGSFQGISANCVIAGHRSLRQADMFRNLDRLQIGDRVTVTNLWETLTYEVVETKITTPSEFDKVLIQEGRDLLALSTCHPYRYNYQRYIVYCERVLDDSALALHEEELGLFRSPDNDEGGIEYAP